MKVELFNELLGKVDAPDGVAESIEGGAPEADLGAGAPPAHPHHPGHHQHQGAGDPTLGRQTHLGVRPW